MSDLEKAKRELSRWTILRILDAGRPGKLDEAIILAALNDTHRAGATPSELRRELDYLADRELIEVERTAHEWFARLTHHGIDLVEYTVDVEPGIARPPRW